MATEENQKTNRRENPRNPEARGLEFKIGSHNSAEQKERSKRGDPLGQVLESGGFQAHDPLHRKPTGLNKRGDIRLDAGGQQRLSTDVPHGFLCAQCQQRSLGIDDLVTDLHLFIEVHKSIYQLGVVSIFLSHTAKVSGVVGNDLCIHGFRNFLTTSSHWRGSSDGTHRGHENLLRAQCDQRARRAGIRVHIGVGGNRTLGEHLHDFFRRLQIPARCVHIQNDSGCRHSLGIFQSPAQEEKLRFAHRSLHGQNKHRPSGNAFFSRLQRQELGKAHKNQKKALHIDGNLPRAQTHRKVFSARGTHLRGNNPARQRC